MVQPYWGVLLDVKAHLREEKNKQIIDSFYRLLNLDCGMLLLPINLFCRRFTMQHGVKIVQPADEGDFVIRDGRYVL